MGIWVMAGMTLREAARKKLLWIALIAATGFLALFALGFHFEVRDLRVPSPILRERILNSSVIMGLYVADLLTMLMTILISAGAISNEISSGTIQAIAAKPLTRREILLGKWLGFAGMLTVYIALTLGGVAALGHFISGAPVPNLLQGLGLVWLEGVLLLNVTLLCGISFSTLATGIMVLALQGLAFLGGWIEQIGATIHSQGAMNVGMVARLLMPSETLWRRAAFEMLPQGIGTPKLSPFGTASVPNSAMMIYAVVYLLAALGLALRHFRLKDL